jgi:PKD repeat protein
MVARGFRAPCCAWPIASLALAVSMTTSCSRVPLTAPTKSTITLYTTASAVPLNGTADLIANITEEAGTAVPDGTLVTFNTTLGHLQPTSAHTINGQATVTLVAGDIAGTATISAYSGGATASGSGTSTSTVAATVQIAIGAAATDTIVAHAEPGSLPPNGGTVQIIAQVRDASGNGIQGVPITFTATGGQIRSPVATSDATGAASTAFTTTSKATVTAHAGAKTADVVVDVAALPAVTLSASPTSPVAGQPVNFTITIDTTNAPNPVRNVRIDYGDGDFEDLGPISGSTSVAHVYASSGTQSVTVTLTDTTGQQVTQVLSLVVLASSPMSVTLSVTPNPATVNTAVTLQAVVSGSTLTIQSYDWDFGDSTVQTTTGALTTKIYTTAGTFHAKVTVHATDGSAGLGAADVTVTP